MLPNLTVKRTQTPRNYKTTDRQTNHHQIFDQFPKRFENIMAFFSTDSFPLEQVNMLQYEDAPMKVSCFQVAGNRILIEWQVFMRRAQTYHVREAPACHRDN